MKYNIVLIFFCFVFLSASLQAQIDSAYSKTAESYFHFSYENDFFTGTDRYYTQGVWIEYTAAWLKYSPLSYILPRMGASAVNAYGLQLKQQCFTPSTILRSILLVNDRPWAATFFLGQFLISANDMKKQQLTTGLIAGVEGPCAICEQEQIAIHKGLHNLLPEGWQYQVRNSPIINYDLKYEYMPLRLNGLAITAFGEGRAGTLYDNAGAGASMRFGWFNKGFYNTIPNGLPGRFKKFQVYLDITGKGNLVAYNGTLQGGLFSKDNIYTVPETDIEHGVLTGGGGFTLVYKKFSIGYSKTWITREFTTGMPHAWGSVNIYVR